MIIKLGPENQNEINILSTGCIFVLFLGLYFIFEYLAGQGRGVNQFQGGIFLLIIAGIFLLVAYQQNMYIEIDNQVIVIERSLFFISSVRKIDFKEIDYIEAKGLMKNLKIHLKSGDAVSLAGSLRILSGKIEDISDPATSLAGRPRDMTNLKNELEKRISAAH